MSDGVERLAEILREESAAASDTPEGAEHAALLRRLAETMDDMTPAERTWVQEASEQDLRTFARSLRDGCADGD